MHELIGAGDGHAQHLRHLAGEIITNVRELAHAGWTPATSSNFSRRLDDRHAAITVSGRDKGRLTEADIMVVDFDGEPVGNDKRPSAETLLHTQLYRRFAEIGCVLHTHSLNQTVASRLFAPQGHVRFEDYELQKAFAGNSGGYGTTVKKFSKRLRGKKIFIRFRIATDATPDVYSLGWFIDDIAVGRCR